MKAGIKVIHTHYLFSAENIMYIVCSLIWLGFCSNSSEDNTDPESTQVGRLSSKILAIVYIPTVGVLEAQICGYIAARQCMYNISVHTYILSLWDMLPNKRREDIVHVL